MKWISSTGGPLICIDRCLASSWLGILGNSLNDAHSKASINDYERACLMPDYLGAVELPIGSALILGDMPLETTVWHPAFENPLLVRAFYMDPDVDLLKLLEAHGNLNFAEPIESVDFDIQSGNMVVFDSTLPGARYGEESLSFDLLPGRYQILTKNFELDDRTSVLMHKFSPKIT